MSGWIIASILLVNFILQSTVFQYIAIMGVKPDTALALVVAFSVLLGDKWGALVGLATGLLQDIVFGSPVGIITLSYMFTGFMISENSTKVFKEHLVVPLIFTAGATVTKYIIVIFFNYALGIEPPLLLYIKRYLPIETLYNCVLSVIIYKLIFKLSERQDFKVGLTIKRKGH